MSKVKASGRNIMREIGAAKNRMKARAERFKKHDAKPVFSHEHPASQFGAAIKRVDPETRALIDAALSLRAGGAK